MSHSTLERDLGLSVLWENGLCLSQSTLGGGFEPEPEYSGRDLCLSQSTQGGVLGLRQSTLGETFGPKPEYSGIL